ncbi:Bug family tripartite tricarboxylate transporter substrate binding protein [Vannielia litorea]|uniref:Tripartite-type tricarboxylate transporter, receptor component TctC n=1 Tax=Vannielia litorea TaxID=1217970 RepID=A0A1N6GHI3_9RHOB|nr:tripartite tricarboxylate transporter substrate-binding protein [Vannielia litorea]SIO07008.1 Tripartite-type tricarboxylate transporter, receptor component TctC [Vannielia litorea]
MHRSLLPGLLAFICTLLAALPATAQDRPALPGRIDYLIGSDPGGGYDRYGRLVARYMETHLDGVTVVPVNRGSAGGVSALRDLKDATDGSAIMIFNTGILMNELGGLGLGLQDYRWIGKASSEARVLLVATATGITSFEALRREGAGLIFVTSAHGSSAFIQTSLIDMAFGIGLKIVPGFGGNEAEAALMKGEVQGSFVSESNVAPLVEAGVARPLLLFGKPSDPALEGVPRAADLALEGDALIVARAIGALTELGRITVAAPGIDPELLEELRAAYAAALADPGLKAEAAEQGMPLDPLPGPEVDRLAEDVLGQSRRLEELIKTVLDR